MLRQSFGIALLGILGLCWVPAAAVAANEAAPARTITVFAAASLTDVLQELGNKYTQESGTRVVFSFAATSVLARQIENGARADLFFAADTEWMDYLEQRSLIQSKTRHNLLGNRLALVASADSAIRLQIASHFPLLAALQGGRLSVADPDSVPAGRYARSALVSLGVWNDVADHLVRAENVRGALLFVSRGEAPLGIVYESDALVEHRVHVLGLFPEDSHPPITYPLALTRHAAEQAQAFVDYLHGSTASAAFIKYGFAVLHK
jgi:molybdate transport system substrate-binding protein